MLLLLLLLITLYGSTLWLATGTTRSSASCSSLALLLLLLLLHPSRRGILDLPLVAAAHLGHIRETPSGGCCVLHVLAVRWVVVVDLGRQVARVTVVVRGQEVDGHQEFLARSKGCYAEHLQVLFGQRGEHVQIDFVRHKVSCKRIEEGGREL